MKKVQLRLTMTVLLMVTTISSFQCSVLAEGVNPFDETITEDTVEQEALNLAETVSEPETQDQAEAMLEQEVQKQAEDDRWDELADSNVSITDSIIAWVYGSDGCLVYVSEDTDAVQDVLNSGYQVRIRKDAGEVNGRMPVTYDINGVETNGYIGVRNMISADENFLDSSEITYELEVNDEAFETYITANFPQSYRPYLRRLHALHPTWFFVAQNTGLDWTKSVDAEMTAKRSLVENSKPDSWKSQAAGDYDPATGTYIGKSGKNWVQASRSAVEYCMDPRNYLNEQNIFAFEQLTYQPSIQNREGVDAILMGTWMYGTALEDRSGGLYRDCFMDLGKAAGVSPYHLAARVRQEQGPKGTSALISGTYTGYTGVYGYYNYFNIGATGTTEKQVIVSGLEYARDHQWNCRATAILEGANFIAKNYIKRGQDTLYLEKFDVDSSDGSIYSHQYMQNIVAAFNEGASAKKAYLNYGVLENAFAFRIPVFNNMPSVACTVEGGNNSAFIEQFVTNLYRVILGREPDADGVASWSESIRNGYSASNTVSGFVFSEEFQAKNLSDEEYISFLYRAVLMREADEGGLANWKKELSEGASRKWVLSCFLSSEEFGRSCAEYGMVTGVLTLDQAIDNRPDLAKFVARMYRNVLLREPEYEGMVFWTDSLSKGVTASQLLEEFLYSKEFLDKKMDTVTYINVMYRTILGREPEPDGMAYWTEVMERDADMRRVIAADFCASEEFATICENYHIKPGAMNP